MRHSEPFADREDESFVPLQSETSLLGNGGRGLRATRNVAAKEIPYRGGDLLRVLQQEHVAAALDLLHFAVGQSVREICSSFC